MVGKAHGMGRWPGEATGSGPAKDRQAPSKWPCSRPVGGRMALWQGQELPATAGRCTMAEAIKPCRTQWLLGRGVQWSGRLQPLPWWAKCWMLAGGCCCLIAKPSTSHPPFQPPPDKDPLGRSLLAKSLASGIHFFFVGPS